jgi:predicted NAD/FAD-binding protein
MIRERIAVIGSGISGLGCARFLDRWHEVTLIESEGRAGGHAHTVEVTEPGTGRRLPVDVGFMVYNAVTYPLLCRLFRELGTVARPTSMSFSVRHDPANLEWSGSSLNHLFAQRRNLLRPSHWRLLLQINRFNQLAAEGWKEAEAETTPLAEWCAARGLGADFLDKYLVPMSSAVWSTPPELMLRFPAAKLLRFFHNHGFLGLHTQHPWLTPGGGSRTYVEALRQRLKGRVRLGEPAESVRRIEGGAEVRIGGQWERYDRIILATHAPVSLRLLSDADAEERRTPGTCKLPDLCAAREDDAVERSADLGAAQALARLAQLRTHHLHLGGSRHRGRPAPFDLLHGQRARHRNRLRTTFAKWQPSFRRP